MKRRPSTYMICADSFTHKWVKNGKIFVKRRVNDRATRIVSEKDLSRLLVRQGNPREKGSRASNATDSSRYGVNPGNRWPRMRFTNLSENNQSSSRDSTSAPAFKQIGPTKDRALLSVIFLQRALATTLRLFRRVSDQHPIAA